MNLQDMVDELAKVWKPAEPDPSKTPPTQPSDFATIHSAIRKIQAGVKTDLQNLNSISSSHQKFSELDQLVSNLRDHQSAAQQLCKGLSKPTNCEYLVTKLSELDEFLQSSASLTENKALENNRAFFKDAADWAIHFSTVRMTVTTLCVTISWGIVSLKWDDYSRPLLIAAIVVAIVTLGLLRFFSEATCHKTEAQKKLKNLIETGQAGSGPIMPRGWRLLFLYFPFKAMCWFPKKPIFIPLRTWVTIWTPVALLTVLTGLFMWLLGCWAYHEPSKKIVWNAVVEPVEKEQFYLTNSSGTVFRAVQTPASPAEAQQGLDIHKQMLTNLAALNHKLEDIKGATESLKPELVTIQKEISALGAPPAEFQRMSNQVMTLMSEVQRLQTDIVRLNVALSNRPTMTMNLVELTRPLASIEQTLFQMQTNLLAWSRSSTNSPELRLRNTGLFFQIGHTEMKAK